METKPQRWPFQIHLSTVVLLSLVLGALLLWNVSERIRDEHNYIWRQRGWPLPFYDVYAQRGRTYVIYLWSLGIINVLAAVSLLLTTLFVSEKWIRRHAPPAKPWRWLQPISLLIGLYLITAFVWANSLWHPIWLDENMWDGYPFHHVGFPWCAYTHCRASG